MTKKTDDTTAGGTTNSASTGTDIMQVIEHRPEIVLLQPESAELLFAHIEAEVEAFEPDMTTAKGRDLCRALAAKVTKTKTTVDKSRLALTEEARARVKIVNESGAKIKERLEALADRARAPLTAWETAEDARLERCRAALASFRDAAIVPLGATSDSLRATIADIQGEAMSLTEDEWQGMLELATTERGTALKALTAALERVEQEELDRAELIRLREAAAAREAEIEQERAARERAESEAREAEEVKAREAQDEADREAEQARQEQEAADRAEQQRIESEQAATAAAERAREEEAARAEEQAAETQRAHDEALAAERRAREEAEERERQRLAAEQAAAAERAKLEANQARRTAAKREAKEAIMTVTGITEDQAKAIVLLLISGEIPRCYLDFAAEPKVKPEPKPEGAML